jgi:hypothetical protein
MGILEKLFKLLDFLGDQLPVLFAGRWRKKKGGKST